MGCVPGLKDGGEEEAAADVGSDDLLKQRGLAFERQRIEA